MKKKYEIPESEELRMELEEGLLYITGAPYDAVHAATAAVFIFLFGDLIIRKLERVKIKYGIYR